MTDNLPSNRFASANLATGDLARHMQNLARSVAVVASGVSGPGNYLRMNGHTGVWTYTSGNEIVDVEDGTEFAVNILAMQTGFIAWSVEAGGKPLGKQMRPAFAGNPVTRGELPPVNGDWSENVQIMLRCLTGEDAYMDFDYSASTKGAVKAFRDFSNAIIAQSQLDPERLMPVVKLGHQGWRHSQRGHFEDPVLQIVRWMTLAEAEALPYRDANGTIVNQVPPARPAPPPAAAAAPPPAATTTTRRRRSAAT